jgi:hypothetical protein
MQFAKFAQLLRSLLPHRSPAACLEVGHIWWSFHHAAGRAGRVCTGPKRLRTRKARCQALPKEIHALLPVETPFDAVHWRTN